MPLSDKVRVDADSAIHYRCWRAKELIKAGEKVWWAGEWDDKDDLKVKRLKDHISSSDHVFMRMSCCLNKRDGSLFMQMTY